MKTLIFTLLFYIISVFSKSISTRDHWKIYGFAHKAETWQLACYFITITGDSDNYNCTYTNKGLCRELSTAYGGLDTIDRRLKDICAKVETRESCNGYINEVIGGAKDLHRELLQHREYSPQECRTIFGLCSMFWSHYRPLLEVCEQMMVSCVGRTRQDAANHILLRGLQKDLKDPDLFRDKLGGLCYKLGDLSPELRGLCVNWKNTWEILKEIAGEECPQLEEALKNALRTEQVTHGTCQLLSRCAGIGECSLDVKRLCLQLTTQCLMFRHVDGSVMYDSSKITEYEVNKFFFGIYEKYGFDIQPHDYASQYPEDPSLSLMLYREGSGPFDPSCPRHLGDCDTHRSDSYLLSHCDGTPHERRNLCDGFQRRMEYDNPHGHIGPLYNSFSHKNTSNYRSDKLYSSSFYNGYDRDFCRHTLADCFFYVSGSGGYLKHNCDRAQLICTKKSMARLLVKDASNLHEEDDFIERTWCGKRLTQKCIEYKDPDPYTLNLCLHPGDTCNVYDY
ncbi:uncharacterized protein T551_03673 [Pneumocystis jirovecii RU7]|uniref:Uncharacterized protein n=1 Tax=Pneumocystis jirovecii (strain RU7) TaxID=1408657 RepID=A0A0W4ZBK9_PNEJ7|nr:uncharacterized protein T551_03673 [Pneumocystis jirovecii RU7]KTW25808.1 hypothetical protein T551_03673 [Pneumocystis jirovecii RU7]